MNFDRKLRQTLVQIIYFVRFQNLDESFQSLLNDKNFNAKLVEVGIGVEFLTQPLFSQIQECLSFYFANKIEIENQILSSLSDVNKTFLITECILSVFLIEKKLSPDFFHNLKTKFNNYLKISENFTGSEGVSVVYALMQKLAGSPKT